MYTFKITLLLSLLSLLESRNVTLCNFTLNSHQGVITSPNYPNPYPTDVSCIWKISAPPGFYVQLSFHDFDIEPYKDCRTDVVEVKDGPSRHSPLLGPPYCNNRKPEPVMTSSRNELRIWFSSDSTLQHRGFNATYRMLREQRCGGDIRNMTHGTITSPRFPLDYPREKSCEWNIEVPRGKHVVLKFESFELETVCPVGSPCRCLDYVSVKDAHNPLGRAGKHCIGTPLPLVASSNRLIVAFKSDKYGRDRGFKASFTQSSTKRCGADHFSKQGVVESPLYDAETESSYPAYSNCVWTINVGLNEYISLRFPILDVLPSQWNDCTSDYVELRDGGSPHSPLIGTFCNAHRPPKVVTSTGNQLFIRFVSNAARKDARNEYKVGRGFQLRYNSHSNSCTSSLGMEDGRILDSQIFATSALDISKWPFSLGARFGRLNNQHAWCSQRQRVHSEGEYFQINFKSLTKITRMSLQGYRLDGQSYFVKKFKLQYESLGGEFEYYVSDEDTQRGRSVTELAGNEFFNATKSNALKPPTKDDTLNPPLWSRSVRLVPVVYQTGSRGCICMKVELFGCKVAHMVGSTNVWSAAR